MNNLISKTIKISTIMIIPILSACSVGSNHATEFGCKAVEGNPCTTITDADGGHTSKASLVTPANGNTVEPYDPPRRNFWGKIGTYKGTQKTSSKITNPEFPTAIENEALVFKNGRNLAASRYNAQSQRIPEILGTLWVASYLDEENILHDASYVHFVIQKAGWANVSR